MSLIGGWNYFSKKYPYNNLKYTNGRLYKLQSIVFNFIGRYKYCINIIIFDDGFLLKPSLFYSFFHKPIFIEYKNIKSSKMEKFIIIDYLRLNLEDKSFKISGDSTKEIKNKLG
jgi:hypothetical protein